MKTVQQEKKNCCGCTACLHICPVDAITMRSDEEGFLYPAVDEEKCIKCGKCKAVCNFKADYIRALPREERASYAVVHKDEPTRLASRSGGVFFALATAFLQAGDVVYGVALDDRLLSRHVRVSRTEDLPPLQGSKYVQSDKNDCFVQVKKDLETGKRVLFSGVACEVAGLLSYLEAARADTARLYTVDIVCHGDPSPLVWQENLRWLEKKYGKITEVSFRDKRFGWRSHIESYVAGGKTHYANLYSTLFGRRVIMRPSCFRCPYCNMDRVGDMTIADFWGVENYALPLELSKGVSLLMCHTQKGKEALTWVTDKVEMYPVSEEHVRQPNLKVPTPEPSDRETFWQVYREKGYLKAGKQCYAFKERGKLHYHIWRKRLGL